MNQANVGIMMLERVAGCQNKLTICLSGHDALALVHRVAAFQRAPTRQEDAPVPADVSPMRGPARHSEIKLLGRLEALQWTQRPRSDARCTELRKPNQRESLRHLQPSLQKVWSCAYDRCKAPAYRSDSNTAVRNRGDNRDGGSLVGAVDSPPRCAESQPGTTHSNRRWSAKRGRP